MGRVMVFVVLLLSMFLLVMFPCAPALASWLENGNAICTAVSDQMRARICSDGAGGAIITWDDMRGGSTVDYCEIYAQRIDAFGNIRWAVNGVPICTAAYAQMYPEIVLDGAGGAIISWQDNRTLNDWNIYAQRVNASGAVQWAANGVLVCAATRDQDNIRMTPDGAGGAILTWRDRRVLNNDNVSAQRLSALGAVQWAGNGVALCAATGDQWGPTITTDGGGGAIVTWYDGRSGSNTDIYVQRVNASGTVQWTPDGVALCTATNDQVYPQIASDGARGAIVTWHDGRDGAHWHTYVQHIRSSGVVDPNWPTNGRNVSASDATDQWNPKIVSDGAGGAIVTWLEGVDPPDIYAQHVIDVGVVDPDWPAFGRALCTAAGEQFGSEIVTDGAGGAIVVWADMRSGTYRIYAQHVYVSGVVDPAWPHDGRSLCVSGGIFPMVAWDGAEAALVTYLGYAEETGWDICAQRVERFGRIGNPDPIITEVHDVPHDQGGKVRLVWNASSIDAYPVLEVGEYWVWREVPASVALQALSADLSFEVGGSSSGRSDIGGNEGGGPSHDHPRYCLTSAQGTTYAWEYLTALKASGFTSYSYVAPTAFDSIPGSNPYTLFMVQARAASGLGFWSSAPDSGYSVDNLPPATPHGLAGRQTNIPPGLDLTWDHNTESDFWHYAIYRGTSAGFAPSPSNLIASPEDPIYFDGDWRSSSGYYYKISASDIHGMESPVALLGPQDVTGADTPQIPETTYLSQNFPNPFNPMTKIEFGLSAPGHVSLRIYDAAGRLLRALVNDERRAGKYEETWDGRNERGETVASGIYFYQLSTSAFESTRKLILLR